MDTNHHLETMGSAVASMLDEGALAVRIVAEVHDDWIERRYDLVLASGTREGVPGERSINRAVNDALMAVRRDMLEAGQPDWHHCVFSLDRDGTFLFEIDRGRLPSA